jgi:hypothetical protein
MERRLTSLERRQIERELIAREEVQLKRKRYFHFIFVVGITSAVLAAFFRVFRISSLIAPLLGVVALVCVLIYSGFLTAPRKFSQDMSPGWHLNRWPEAFQRMSSDGRLIQGLIMLAIYPFCLLFFSLVSSAFGFR